MMKFSKNNIKRKTLFIKTLPLAAAILLSTNVFAQETTGTEQEKDRTTEFQYKQRHSNLVTSQDNLFADGIKIKRDLSLLKEAQEQRILAADEIPAEDLYGGIWVSNKVAAYADILKEAPDTFTVDLSNFTMPAIGRVTSPFGMRRRRMHYGMDIKVQTGDTIYAAFDGKIRVRQYERRGYGYYLVVRHPNGLETVYGHLSKFLVNVDDVVKSGDPIALGGNTGRSFGSHLHFEIRYLGKHMDPREIVDFNNYVCHKDTYTITPETFNFYGSKYRTYDPKSPNKYTSGGLAYHRIKSGDTLGAIARKYGTSVSQLCRLNGIKSTSVLRVGRSIRIS